jgi:hypothetical protein
MDDFTITTIYFDGQFWCAFIQKMKSEILYTGRYVFGEEPPNPRLLAWMLYEFSDIPLYKTDQIKKIRIKDAAKKHREDEKKLPKSFGKFREAQKLVLADKKGEKKRQEHADAEEKYRKKQEKKKLKK